MIVVANSAIFGQNLRYLRQRRTLSVAEMATLLQMEADRLEALEQGLIFDIEAESLHRVCKIFDEAMEDIFCVSLADGCKTKTGTAE